MWTERQRQRSWDGVSKQQTAAVRSSRSSQKENWKSRWMVNFGLNAARRFLLFFAVVGLSSINFSSGAGAQGAGRITEAIFNSSVKQVLECEAREDLKTWSRFPKYRWLILDPTEVGFDELMDPTMVAGPDEIEAISFVWENTQKCGQQLLELLRSGGGAWAAMAANIDIALTEHLLNLVQYASGAQSRGQVFTRTRQMLNDLESRGVQISEDFRRLAADDKLIQLQRDRNSILSDMRNQQYQIEYQPFYCQENYRAPWAGPSWSCSR